MKTYSISLHYEFISTIEVDAENDDEALDIANQIGDSIDVSEMENLGLYECEIIGKN